MSNGFEPMYLDAPFAEDCQVCKLRLPDHVFSDGEVLNRGRNCHCQKFTKEEKPLKYQEKRGVCPFFEQE